MSGFTRIINGSPINLPGLYPTESEQLHRIIDELEAKNEQADLFIKACNERADHLERLLKADISAREKSEALQRIGAEVHVEYARQPRRWWPFGQKAERR